MADYVHKTEFSGFYSRFKVGDKVKFRDPEFEDDKVHTVKKVDVETLNGHPWKIRIELENGVRRYDDHFILANAARSRNASRNAKFKVGDKVKYTGRDALVYGKTGSVGTVKYVDNVLFGGKCPLYEVEFPESPGDTDTISEERLRLANSRSRNAVVQKALNAVARNVRAIPVDSKGKGIVERCKIRTTDGEVGEVAHIDEDGFVYFEAKDGRIRGVPADTVVRLNADTSVIRKTAVNGVWETENKLEREIARTVGSDIDVGIYGSAVAIGGVPDETSSVNVKAIVERILGPVTSWQVKKDIIGYTIHAKVARSIPNAARSTNAVVAKAMNARRAARNAGDPGHFTSDELSALKGAFAGLNGASFSQYPNKSREQLAVRGENGILITVQKYAFDGEPVKFDIRGQGPRSAFGVKFVSSIREAVTAVKRMLASAKKQSPYSFSKYD